MQKMFLLVSTLVTSSLAGLLIPREKYLQHTLMKDGATGLQCDDCCDKAQQLENEYKIKFFGETHDKFWPCANGLISFKGQVDEYTPVEFPIANQPVIAAFWGDVDLRRCRPDLGMRCSYFKVFYDKEASFLNHKITQDYMDGEQTFTAKVAIVQTWDRVGYYDKQTNKENTFQIVIVSDGFDNTFAGMYYDKIEWTTGDDSGGTNGLGGTQAQMGFDDGKKTKYFAHEWSRTEDILKLANQEFVFAISDLKICGSGEALVDNKCVPRSCSVQNPFPILDIKGQKRTLDDGKLNDNYVQPPVLVGGCAKHLVNVSKKVRHGTKCYLQCEFDAEKRRTSQPKNTGNLATTNEGVAAVCDSAIWVENAAQNCVEVGIKATVSNADAAGKFQVRESVDANAETIQVSLKSKPYIRTGAVVVELQTSCKNGEPLHSRMQGSEKKFFCKDDPNDTNKETKPLAEFQIGGRSHYVTTLLFTASNWNVPKKLSIKGIDNQEKSLQGFEKFKVFLRIDSADDENCDSVGCSTQTPYTLLKPISISGELTDNEVLEIKPIKDSASLISDESGAEALFFLRPVVDNNSQYVGKKLSCTSSDQKEGMLVAYSEGNVQSYLTSEMDVSKLGARKQLKDGETITLTEQDVTFYVAGQPDDIVDGPRKYQIKCALADSNLGAILPLDLTNEDKNTPGINVTISGCTDNVVHGCGRMQTAQAGPGTDAKVAYIEIKLATRPRNDVLVQVEAARKKNKGDNDKVQITPSFEKFTPTDWMVPRRFKVAPASADILDAMFGGERVLQEQVFITVDSSGTKDTGLSIFHVADNKYEHVLGYASCGAGSVSDATTTAPADSGVLGQEELERRRRRMSINCFSYDSSKITGLKSEGKVPDEPALQLGVDVDNEVVKTATEITFGAILGIVAAVTITLAIFAISGYLVAMAIRRRRGEEADRKADVKKGADRAENDISFRMDEMENGRGMADLEGTTSRLKGERDRLKEENQKLATEVGEEPMLCADTEDSDALVEQIKLLKGENDRLRDLQQSNSNKRNRRKKKKAGGFGQHKE